MNGPRPIACFPHVPYLSAVPPPSLPFTLPLLALLLSPPAAGAQLATRRELPSIMIGAQAIGVVTRVSPAFDGRVFTEGYLTQPAIMAHARLLGGRATLRAMIDFEGLTLLRGELTPGSYGEGYVDRRHPHTYTHEVMATLTTPDDMTRRFAASLSAGKGFAPFGTDDPMMRPFVKFPANHHLAQILERVSVIGAARVGAVVVEAGAFNGDEPETPSSVPEWGRFGDSWSGRVTVAPRRGALAGLEVQGSGAWVESPEYRPGGASDQLKWSASARFERGPPSGPRHRYALVEWARTDEVVNGRHAFTFTSLLAEGMITGRRGSLALRAERSVRPEEERLANPFRAVRPHTDASILGRTRWAILTAQARSPALGVAGVRAQPLIEIAHSRATEMNRPSAFQPERFFGSERQWSISAGLRLELGARHHRMGRYGTAEATAARHAHADAADGEPHDAPHPGHDPRPVTSDVPPGRDR